MNAPRRLLARVMLSAAMLAAAGVPAAAAFAAEGTTAGDPAAGGPAAGAPATTAPAAGSPAQTAGQPLLSADQEQRADKLAHGLRCLVCQNQTLAESNAPLAQDMRKLIRGQLAEGKTDTQIMRFFEDRYGDFVRYDPPFKPVTWLLWLGPFALLALGFLVLVRTLKRRAGPRAPLTADERERAARFLDTGS